MTTTEALLDPAFLRKLDRLALVLRKAMPGAIQGERRSPRRGASVEFADFRPYTTGDDIRQIDWNLYARMEKFFLKLFVAEEELNIHLLIDASPSMNWGEPNKLQYARKIAAAFGYVALSNLDRVVVHAFGANQQLPSVRGKRGAIALFQFLQRIPVSEKLSLAQACQRYAQRATSPGPLLLCSDLFDPDWEAALTNLAARSFEITLMQVLAPEEIDPQIDGDFRLIDSESGLPIEISADPDVRRRYRESFLAWQEKIEHFCSGRGITFIRADSSVEIEEFFLSQMRRRGVLR